MKKTTTTITAKQIAIAVAAVCASLSMPAVANENKAMLDLMLKKGVITQKDYDQFMEANKDADENKAFKDSRIDQDVSKSIKFIQKRDKDGAVSEAGNTLTSNNGQNTFNLTGRLHFDTRMIDNSLAQTADRDTASIGDNFEVRRARIGINGKLFNDINYELVTNAVGSSPNLIDTAWLNYGFNKDAQVRLGRFKQPFSLEELTSSNNIDFMERSYNNQLVPGKRLGAMLHGEPVKGINYGVSVFQDGFNEITNEQALGSNQAARFAVNFAELNTVPDMVLHVGLGATGGRSQTMPVLSGNTQKATSNSETRATFMAFRTESRGLANAWRAQISGDSLPSSASFGDTSNNAATISKMQGALELAIAKGPYKFQTEYMRSKYDATHPSVDYSGGSETGTALGTASLTAKADTVYYEVMYNVTGESWSDYYRSGVFGGLKPKNNFGSGGGTGAWQVGFRWSEYDASGSQNEGCGSSNNRCGLGGTNRMRYQNSAKANTWTLALNWYLNPNARVMLNYAQTSFGTAVEALDTVGDNTTTLSERVISLRSQINF